MFEEDSLHSKPVKYENIHAILILLHCKVWNCILLCLCRVELCVILADAKVEKRERTGTTITPDIPYEEVGFLWALYCGFIITLVYSVLMSVMEATIRIL